MMPTSVTHCLVVHLRSGGLWGSPICSEIAHEFILITGPSSLLSVIFEINLLWYLTASQKSGF